MKSLLNMYGFILKTYNIPFFDNMLDLKVYLCTTIILLNVKWFLCEIPIRNVCNISESFKKNYLRKQILN